MDTQTNPNNVNKLVYADKYDPTLLKTLNRAETRHNAAISMQNLALQGVDIWNNFDMSWLNPQGTAEYAMLSIHVPCNSTYMLEAKALKLYLYSFANSQFTSMQELEKIIQQDLSKCTDSTVQIYLAQQLPEFMQVAAHFSGTNLDDSSLNCSAYALQTDFLRCDAQQIVTEQLCSDLLQIVSTSGKPDWGSLRISYSGAKIDPEALLKYIVSYRKHPILPELCIERIYCDLIQFCKPSALTVEGAFTRRGTLDLYPIRSMTSVQAKCERLFRQ